MLLIDQNGETWPAYGRPQNLLTDGCVLLWPDRQKFAIHCKPHRVSIDTLIAIEKYLYSTTPERIWLSTQEQDSNATRDKLCDSPREALSELIALMFEPSACYDRYLMQQRPPVALSAVVPLHPILDLWRSTGGRISMNEHGQRIANYIGTYLTACIDDGTVRFSELGMGWAIYQSRNWLTQCIGKPVEHQPDIAYGKWVAANYHNLRDITEPVAMDCDVLIQDPTGDGDKRVRYTRLTLPVTGRDGRRHLLSTSCRHASFELRSPVAQV